MTSWIASAFHGERSPWVTLGVLHLALFYAGGLVLITGGLALDTVVQHTGWSWLGWSWWIAYLLVLLVWFIASSVATLVAAKRHHSKIASSMVILILVLHWALCFSLLSRG